LGITPFVIATEQNFIQAAREHLGKGMHYKFIAPKPVHGFNDVEDMLKKINQLSYENLTKVIDPFKQSHQALLQVVTVCNKFVCDCCGKDWGRADQWSTDRALVFDSLSGLSDMAWGLVVGNKPVRAMPDYQVAQNAIRMLIDLCTTQCKCMFVLTAHIDREPNQLTGGTNITLKTIGQKLGPDLPRLFSDVIRCQKLGHTFVWDTEDMQSTVVARHLKIGSNLPASFGPLIETWKARGGQINASPQS
jgi:hypothetical protein